MADPMYRRIADELRQQIESGRLKPETRLPTEVELGQRFNASRNTIRDAVKLLIVLGLVETRPGQGTFVTKRVDPFVTVLSAEPETGFGGGEGAALLSDVTEQKTNFEASKPRIEIQGITPRVSQHLRLEEGEQVVSRHQERTIDNRPWSLQTTFYPMKYVLQGATRLIDANDIPEGAVRYLQKELGLRQSGYSDWITVRSPDANEITYFNLPGDGRVSVFEIFRTAYDQDQVPMRLTITVFPADQNQFIVNVGKVPQPATE